MARNKHFYAYIILVLSTAIAGYFILDYWYKTRDSDGDGLTDWMETNKYHTDPFKIDTDDDTLNDKFEVEHSLDPLKPNPIYAYLMNKDLNYSLFKSLESDGVMQLNEKKLIDYFNSLPAEFKAKEKVLKHLSKIVSDGRITDNELKSFKDWDSDELLNLDEINEYHTDPFRPNPNLFYTLKLGLSKKYLDLVKPLDLDGIQQINERKFDEILMRNEKILEIKTFLNYLIKKSEDGRITDDELSRVDNFSKLVDKLFTVINLEEMAEDKLNITDYAVQLSLKFNFDSRKATDATIKTIGEYAVAVKNGLPEELNALSILINCTQNEKYGAKLVDFSQIIFHSIDGNDYSLKINVPRNIWILARQIYLINKSGFDISKYPEMFEGINVKVIANSWSLFDKPYGIKYYNKNITPYSREVWDLIMLQWELDSKPIFNKTMLYNRDMPWWNSTKLRILYPNKNTRRQALFFLFYIPPVTWDMKSYHTFSQVIDKLFWEEKRITRNIAADLYELIQYGSTDGRSIGQVYEAKSINDVVNFIKILEEKNKIDKATSEELIELIKKIPLHFKRYGIEGAKTSLLQAWKEYQKISKLYPNGKVQWPVKGVLPKDPRFVYYGWLVDRGAHGLNNTIKEYVGIDWKTLLDIIAYKHGNEPDPTPYLLQYNGLDQYLTKNWKYWDLVKFIVGYERWNPNVTEAMEINYITPDVLRRFGFPNWNIGIEPVPLGTPGAEWAICLPQYIVNDLMNKFSDVLLGPGNLFGLHCCKKGLIAERGTDIYHNPITDGIKYVYLVIDHSKGPIYLMKRD